jgi:hypothetical protein
MHDLSSTGTESGDPRVRRMPSWRLIAGDADWSFVYIFFTNHIPFDAPNRSEPCPRH